MIGVLWAMLGVVAGSFIAFQAPINAQLARGLGLPAAATASSLLTGAVVLIVVSLVFSKVQGVPIAWRTPAPWLFVTGGCLGAAFATSVVILTPRLGAGATMAFIVSGQLLAGIAIDHFGLFGAAIREMSSQRVAGAALMIAGAALIRFF